MNDALFGEDARAGLKRGVDIVYFATSPTLGARGKNAVYRKHGKPYVTNDGVSIARKIQLPDELESMGADLIKEAAEKTNDQAGDGTTTAIILARSMIDRGLHEIKEGVNPMVLKRELEEATKAALSMLKHSSDDVDSYARLLEIATISSESPEIGKVVADSIHRVGRDGVVLVEQSNLTNIVKEDVDGLRFEQGYVSPYMVTNPEKMEAVLTDVPILITDKSFNLNNDLFPLLESIHKTGCTKLLIIAEEISGELLRSIIANRIEGRFHAVVVKKPYQSEVLEDIATLTGGTAITTSKGIVVPNSTHLGSAHQVIVKKDSTTIVGGGGHHSKVEERIQELKKQLEDAEENYDKEKLRDRIAKLRGGITIIKVGAHTEAEMKYLKDKVDDAVAATKAALEEGIVPGGGRTLWNIAQMLKSVKKMTIGESVVAEACEAPLLQILANSGENITNMPDDIYNIGTSGYDALKGEFVKDLNASGIIDPVKVTRCALENASSLAGMFLTTDVCVVELPKEDDILKG